MAFDNVVQIGSKGLVPSNVSGPDPHPDQRTLFGRHDSTEKIGFCTSCCSFADTFHCIFTRFRRSATTWLACWSPRGVNRAGFNPKYCNNWQHDVVLPCVSMYTSDFGRGNK